jgi:glycolate oxidase FAD binding subunit
VDLTQFAAAVGTVDRVTIAGGSTRGGAVAGVRCVAAPSGIDWIQPDEMTVCCGAGTTVAELSAALAEHGQRVNLPAGGTVGGALAVGRSDTRRLGDGPIRDALLQARYVSAAGAIVQAGGPTVKNVSGFDLCRLLVGSRGTLGFLGEVILRTRPVAVASAWFTAAAADPFPIFSRLYRPVSVLWDGATVWALIEGHPADVADQAAAAGLASADGPPRIPIARRAVVAPAAISSTRGTFIAEVGVGVVHLGDDGSVDAAAGPDAGVQAVSARLKAEFDSTRRLNPGVHVG